MLSRTTVMDRYGVSVPSQVRLARALRLVVMPCSRLCCGLRRADKTPGRMCTAIWLCTASVSYCVAASMCFLSDSWLLHMRGSVDPKSKRFDSIRKLFICQEADDGSLVFQLRLKSHRDQMVAAADGLF